MASKAYVASMTVTELKQELKQRGLSTRGSKKNLRDRLERVRKPCLLTYCRHACRMTTSLLCLVTCIVPFVLHPLFGSDIHVPRGGEEPKISN